MLAFLWVIWLRLVERNMLENTKIQVPKCYSLKLFRTSHANVCFWKIPSDIVESQKSECKPLLVQLQSKMHDLGKSQTNITRLYPWSVTENKSFKGYKTILKSKNTDMSKCSRANFFLLPPNSLSCYPTQPWIFNIVLSECPCYKELFRNT